MNFVYLFCRNERPFECTICHKSYKTSSMRAAHMDSHITGKTFEVNFPFFLDIFLYSAVSIQILITLYTFQCTLCDKKLQSRTSYRNHMKRHTEEKKHECEHCGKRFFTRYHLKLHQSKIHKGAMIGSSNDSNNDSVDLVQLMDDSTMIVYE